MKWFPILYTSLAIVSFVLAAEDSKAEVIALGEVERPGRYEYIAGENAWTLGERAGGLSRVWGGVVQITRVVDGEKVTLEYRNAGKRDRDSSSAFLSGISIRPNDIVYFQMIICRNEDANQPVETTDTAARYPRLT